MLAERMDLLLDHVPAGGYVLACDPERIRTRAGELVRTSDESGSETGFARYRPIDTEKWFVSDQRTIVVEDFFAPDTNTYLGLLRFLLGLDLIDRVMFWMLPVDDPLPWLLLDRRAARVTAAHDETWLRIVDVEKSLAARQYEGDGQVTELSTTRYCPTIRSPSPSPDTVPSEPIGTRNFTLMWRALGRFTGGATWHSLTIAGLARAEDPAVLATADRLFTVRKAPHAGLARPRWSRTIRLRVVRSMGT